MANPYGEITSSAQGPEKRRLKPYYKAGETGTFVTGTSVEWDPIGEHPVVAYGSESGHDTISVYEAPHSNFAFGFYKSDIENAGLGDFRAGYTRLVEGVRRWDQNGMMLVGNAPVPPILPALSPHTDDAQGNPTPPLACGEDGSGLMPELGM